jgi:DNA-binding response OmpR family regulator
MKKNILVIDDDPLAQKMIVTALEEEGHAAVASLNFEDAVRRARQTTPDLVLIDVVMPDITGFEACRQIREMFQPHPPPVIVMTGKLDAVDPILARKMGADDFVVKTSDMAVLIQAVRKVFSEKK